MPAYRIAGFNVQGIFDIVHKKAAETAKKFNIPCTFTSLDEMLSGLPGNAVLDVAVPGSETISILEQLPPRASVLFQKPMSENYEQAKNILEITRRKKMLAAVNFQGSKGAIKIDFGALIDYPRGSADRFEYFLPEEKEAGWREMTIDGSWFPDAFIGSMAQVMLAAKGTIPSQDNSVEDCTHTMACVEAAYRLSELGGVKPKDLN